MSRRRCRPKKFSTDNERNEKKWWSRTEWQNGRETEKVNADYYFWTTRLCDGKKQIRKIESIAGGNVAKRN